MEAGHGLKDRQPGEGWTTDELALELGVTRNTVSNWRNGTVPSDTNFKDLLKLVAPRGRRNAAAVRSRLEIAFRHSNEAKRKLDDIEKEFSRKVYSRRDLWNAALSAVRKNFTALAWGGRLSSRLVGFQPQELILKSNRTSFFVPPSDELLSAAQSGCVQYDIHTDSLKLFNEEYDLNGPFPAGLVNELIERHRLIVSDQILSKFQSATVREKPYNKKKFGVWSIEEFVPTGRLETGACKIVLYDTDFFTKTVMARVYRQLRIEYPKAFADMSRYPTLTIGDQIYPCPHFSASIGLNCFVISVAQEAMTEVILTRTASSASNEMQHGRFHLAVNEGIVQEDCPHESDEVDLPSVVERGFMEELGAVNPERLNSFFTDVFLDNPSGEIGILAVVTCDEDRSHLNALRDNSARDKRREFTGTLQGVPCSRLAMVDFILDQPDGINAFTSYFPHLVDILISRGAFSKVALQKS